LPSSARRPEKPSSLVHHNSSFGTSTILTTGKVVQNRLGPRVAGLPRRNKLIHGACLTASSAASGCPDHALHIDEQAAEWTGTVWSAEGVDDALCPWITRIERPSQFVYGAYIVGPALQSGSEKISILIQAQFTRGKGGISAGRKVIKDGFDPRIGRMRSGSQLENRSTTIRSAG